MAKGKGKEKRATDAELFTVDAGGDESLRRSLATSWDAPAAANPRRGSGRPLKSMEILAQRSRVPAQKSKAAPGLMLQQKLEREKRQKISPELKKRLRGMVKRNNTQDRGLWDVSTGAPKEFQMAEIAEGSYDAWAQAVTLPSKDEGVHESIREIVVRPTPKAPTTLHSHAVLTASAVPRAIGVPHPGESYNPTLADHQALLAAEHAVADAEEEEAKRLAGEKEKFMKGIEGKAHPYDTGYADEVGSGEEDEADEPESSEAAAKKAKKQKRKTEREHKRKLANRQLEMQVRQKARLDKSQRQAVSNLSSLIKDMSTSSQISLAQLHKRKTELREKLSSSGLADMRSGPGRVPKPRSHYLLSEELPESLRQLKTDGNLWSEWLDSSKRRGRVQTERRSFARMTKKKNRGMKEIEKVAFRKYEG